jgi:hypothetical protein
MKPKRTVKENLQKTGESTGKEIQADLILKVSAGLEFEDQGKGYDVRDPVPELVVMLIRSLGNGICGELMLYPVACMPEASSGGGTSTGSCRPSAAGRQNSWYPIRFHVRRGAQDAVTKEIARASQHEATWKSFSLVGIHSVQKTVLVTNADY